MRGWRSNWMWLGALLALVLVLGGCFRSPTQAVIGLSGIAGAVPWTVTFDATGSTGPDGITTTHWEFGEEDESYEASGTFVFQHAGTFTVRLTVRAADGSTDVEETTVEVAPAVWVADENLNTVYRLSMTGAVLDSFALPATEPGGLALAVAEGKTWLFVACMNGGNQRILRMDPVTGTVDETYPAPAQSPLHLTYNTNGQKQIWHVDGLSRKIYRLNPPDLQVYESFGQTYFKATSPQVTNVPFLREPQGLDWTPEGSIAGSLWYLEGETAKLYEMTVIPGYDIMSNTQLQVTGDPVTLDAGVVPVSGIDIYDGAIWVVDLNRHRIVELDLTTGLATGKQIAGFPGSRAVGLEIQY